MHPRGKLTLWEYFGTEFNKTREQILKIMVGCKSNSVEVYVNCFQILVIEKTNTRGT